MNTQDIKELLEGVGIIAEEEYFGSEVDPPYAVILEPSAQIDCADLGIIISRVQRYRIELYTKSKKDPVRELFKQTIYGNVRADAFTEETESYGANRLFMTAIEFELLEE